MFDKDKTERVVDECLSEMFKRVGEKYPNKELTDQKEWYTKRSWTEEEEADFRKWLLAKLKKSFPYMRGRKLEMEASMFMLMWSWTNKDIKNDNKNNTGSEGHVKDGARKTNAVGNKTLRARGRDKGSKEITGV